MIQDILPLHLQNQYEKKQPDDTSYMMIYRENKILVREGETLAFLTYRELREICETAGEMAPQSIYLFSVGEETYFLTELPEHLTPEGYCFEKMFAVRSGKPKEHILAAATAWHLYEWYRDNRFCGRCGQKLMHNGTLRMLFCPACGNQVFPKIAPAVIVGVTDGEYILMTTYANREYKRYALIAGFTEIGETAEETFADLSVLLAENPRPVARPWNSPGLPDGVFRRGEVPMTKEEVRAVSVCKLRLQSHHVVWDVGAGTGSVSLECALACPAGRVYAIEKNPAAAALLEENKARLGAYHLTVVSGAAPEVLRDLPAPDRVFLGGTSGSLEEILTLVFEKNPAARVVCTAVTLETVGEAARLFASLEEADMVQLSVTRTRTAGRYHLMDAQNPVWIFSGEGKGYDA